MSKKDMSFRDIVALCNTLGIKNEPKFKIKRGKNGKYQYKARLKLKAKFYLEYSIMDIEKKVRYKPWIVFRPCLGIYLP